MKSLKIYDSNYNSSMLTRRLICGSSNLSEFNKNKLLLECKDCSTIFDKNLFKGNELNEKLNVLFFEDEQKVKLDFYNNLYQKMNARRVVKSLKRYVDFADLFVVEIGCGSGKLLEWIFYKENCLNVGCCDLSQTVLENVKSRIPNVKTWKYVDEIDQMVDLIITINGVLQSLDPYSAYMNPEIFEEMQTETSGEFGGVGIEVSMEAGVVKVITPIDDTPASKAGVKAGDYIVKINDEQVQGKTLMEAVNLMRGAVGT